jgi:hypothetical protein
MGCAASVEAVAAEGKRLLPKGVTKVGSEAPDATPTEAREGPPKPEPATSNAALPEAEPVQMKSPDDVEEAGKGSGNEEAVPAGAALAPTAILSVAGQESSSDRFKDGEATVVFVLGEWLFEEYWSQQSTVRLIKRIQD